MNIIDQLRRDEGEVLHAYQDQYGYWTIGVGILIDARKGGGLRPEESAWILANRVQIARQALTAALPWFSGLNDARQGALLNMTHQMGVEGVLGFPRMLGAMRDERWPDAEQYALQSLWAKQTPDRARRVARQIATGEWQ